MASTSVQLLKCSTSLRLSHRVLREGCPCGSRLWNRSAGVLRRFLSNASSSASGSPVAAGKLESSDARSITSCIPPHHLNIRHVDVMARESPVAERLWKRYAHAKAVAKDTAKVSMFVSPHSIFANNELPLSEIDAYGFDYDYTLAVYTKGVNNLIYELALARLIDHGGYPSDLSKVQYDPSFAIRGLHYDIHRGLLLKLDAFCHIQLGSVYRGRTPLSDEEVKQIYQGTYIEKEYVESYTNQDNQPMKQLLDLFSLPELGLLSNVIEYFNQNNINYNAEALFNDVKGVVRSIHVTGQLYSSIIHHREKYIHPNHSLKDYLTKLQNAGKVIFLLTNSPYPFVSSGMEYLIGANWRDCFHYIIVQSRKPAFFDKSLKPFRHYHTQLDQMSWSPVTYLKPGHVYAEGNVTQFLDNTGLRSKTVLYFGDHVYSDLAEPMLRDGWRTAAVVPELSGEIRTINSQSYIRDSIWLQALTSLIECHQDESMRSADGLGIVQQWLQERNQVRYQLKEIFNSHFGSIFRTYHNPTYFSRRLMRLSDVYTSSVSNFDEYSVSHTFYPRRVALPHELNLSISGTTLCPQCHNKTCSTL